MKIINLLNFYFHENYSNRLLFNIMIEENNTVFWGGGSKLKNARKNTHVKRKEKESLSNAPHSE